MKFTQGKTYDFLIHGVFTAILGILLVLVHPALIAVVVLGITLSIMTSGVQFDEKNHRIRKYYAVGPLVFGEWLSLSDFEKISLRYNGHEGNTYRPIYLNKSASSLRTFDLVLIDKFKLSRTLFEFTDYTLARKVLSKLATLTAIEVEDQIQQQRKQVQQRRRR